MVVAIVYIRFQSGLFRLFFLKVHHNFNSLVALACFLLAIRLELYNRYRYNQPPKAQYCYSEGEHRYY